MLKLPDKTTTPPTVSGGLQVEAEHYYRPGYDTKGRFGSYWHQINELAGTKAASMLEVGKGNGFISHYLRARGFNIQTLDIDPALQPTAVGSVLDIPFRDGAFEAVACYEVLEHLPFQYFSQGLAELCRVSSRMVLMSLPDNSRVYKVSARLPGIKEFKRLIPMPNVPPPTLPTGGEHYWEIGVRGYPLAMVRQRIQDAGFQILKTYRVFEHVRHRFFILRKTAKGAPS